MGVEIHRKLERFKSFATSRRYGAILVYLSMVTLLVAAADFLGNVFEETTAATFINELTSELPTSLIYGLIFAGPALSFFMTWIWVGPHD